MVYRKISPVVTLDELLTKKLEYEIHPVASRIIAEYKRFLALSPNEKAELRQDWINYYKDVKETPVAKNFAAQKAALLAGNLGEVRRRAKLAKTLSSRTLSLPRIADPYFMELNPTIQIWRDLLRQIETQRKSPVVSDVESF